jgi:hypothetical protein
MRLAARACRTRLTFMRALYGDGGRNSQQSRYQNFPSGRLRANGKRAKPVLIACMRKFLVILNAMLHNKLTGTLPLSQPFIPTWAWMLNTVAARGTCRRDRRSTSLKTRCRSTFPVARSGMRARDLVGASTRRAVTNASGESSQNDRTTDGPSLPDERQNLTMHIRISRCC